MPGNQPQTTAYASPKLRLVIAEAVFRRKKLFRNVVLIILGSVAAFTFLLPKKYEAEAKLMVQNVRSAAPLTTSPTDHVMASDTVSPEQINSQVDLLESLAVARRAAGIPLSGGTSEQNAIATSLQHHLAVEAVHQTSLIEIKLQGRSPEAARAQLEKVLAAYFQERAGTALSNGAAGFFEQQVAYKTEQLKDVQQQLTDFEIQHGVADLDGQKKLQMDRIAALQNQLLSVQAQLAAERSRREAERHELSLTPQRLRSTERTITNQYSQEHLSTALVDLENRRAELLKRYPLADQQVVENADKISIVQRAIAKSAQNPAGEQSTDLNPVYQQLSAALATGNGEVSARAAEAATLSGQLKGAQSRLNELEQATAGYDDLKRNLAQAQEDFTLYAQKRDEARVAQQLDKARMFDVSLVEPPIASALPVRPKPALYLATGTIFALLFATLLSLYADTTTDQVYTPAQLDALTGRRTIATVAEQVEPGASETNALAYRKILLGIRNALRERESKPIAYLNGDGSVEPIRNGHDVARAELGGESAGYCIAVVSALRSEGVSHLVCSLASEAASHASARIALLDVRELLVRFERNRDASFAMQYDREGKYWILEMQGSNAAQAEAPSAPARGGLQGLFSTNLKPLLVQARKEFDFIFLDCPSLQQSTIAGELDRTVDGYVGVVGAARARKQNIEEMEALFEQTFSPLLGYVLTRREYPVPRWAHRLL